VSWNRSHAAQAITHSIVHQEQPDGQQVSIDEEPETAVMQLKPSPTVAVMCSSSHNTQHLPNKATCCKAHQEIIRRVSGHTCAGVRVLS
jgi:hypothetical protein